MDFEFTNFELILIIILNKPDLNTLINKFISYIEGLCSGIELYFGEPIFWARVLYYGLLLCFMNLCFVLGLYFY